MLYLQGIEKEQVVFKATQISGDFPMKRFNQPPPDFPVSHLAGKAAAFHTVDLVYNKPGYKKHLIIRNYVTGS